MNKENVKNNRIVRHTYYYFNSIFNRKSLRHKAETTIEKFGIGYPSEEIKNNQIKDMIRMNQLYGFTFEEYLYFHFADKSVKERRAFVADWEHLGYTCAMNDPDNVEIFDNKWKTYQKYRPYYHRDVDYIEGYAGKAAFEEFASRHSDFIVKPLDQSCGHGVGIVHGGDTSFEELLRENNGRFLIEELIDQSEEMAQFHPASVNTVRVTTIKLEEEVLIVHPFMRMGQHGNHVDNGGAGGIMCTIDAESGKIIAAADENGHSFTRHPDSGIEILGFKIPRWAELRNFVTELARIVPDNHYTGWDLALTDYGWVLVEANRRGQFVGWQIPTQVGFREELNKIMKDLGKKY